MGAQLMAIAAEGTRQRYYVAPTEEHEKAADIPRPDDVPEAELPEHALGFRVQGYGMRTWADLFTNRQLTALTTFSDLVQDFALAQGPMEPTPVTQMLWQLTWLSRSAASLITPPLLPHGPAIRQMEILRSTFARQALPMIWDFAKAIVFGPSSGTPDVMIAAGLQSRSRFCPLTHGWTAQYKCICGIN